MTRTTSNADSKLLPLCSTADVPQGAVVRVEKEGFILAVYHVGDRFYVTDDQCTHGPGLLSEGEIEGDVIICNFHYGGFHIPTGRVELPPCIDPIRTYEVSIVDGHVCIDPNRTAG